MERILAMVLYDKELPYFQSLQYAKAFLRKLGTNASMNFVGDFLKFCRRKGLNV